MKPIKKILALALCVSLMGVLLAGCGAAGNGKRIVRISHAQSETHPEHLGLLAFKEYVEENLGDKYEVQIYPNELLGAARTAIELTQTGAIDFVVAGTATWKHSTTFTKFSVCRTCLPPKRRIMPL